MVISINSNLSSRSVQQSLQRITEGTQSSFEKLSSGLRINRASDDAAGLAVSSTLANNTRLYSQALRNVNDGVSALSIMEGAYSELTNITTRIKELAEQSANGSFSSAQRLSMDTEAQALLDEFRRIQRTTSFNGIKLLDGSNETIRFQSGIEGDVNNTLTASGELLSTIGTSDQLTGATSFAGDSLTAEPFIFDVNRDGYNDLITRGSTRFSVHLSNGDGTFKYFTSYAHSTSSSNGVSYGDFNGDGYQDILSSTSNPWQFSIVLANTDGTFKGPTTFGTGAGSTISKIKAFDVNNDGYLDAIGVNSDNYGIALGNGNGTFLAVLTYKAIASSTAPTFTLEDLNSDGNLDIVSRHSTEAAIFVSLGNSNGSFSNPVSYAGPVNSNSLEPQLKDFNGDGVKDILTAMSGTSGFLLFSGNGDGTFRAATSFLSGNTIYSAKTFDINRDGYQDIVAADTNTGYVGVYLGNGNGTFQGRRSYYLGGTFNNIAAGDLDNDGLQDIASSFTTSLVIYNNNISLKTRSSALRALSTTDSALEAIGKAMGSLGAQQSRLKTASSALSILRENNAAAKSRILDVDVAEESAALIKNNILQQVTNSILSQANLVPQLALSLLR